IRDVHENSTNSITSIKSIVKGSLDDGEDLRYVLEMSLSSAAETDQSSVPSLRWVSPNVSSLRLLIKPTVLKSEVTSPNPDRISFPSSSNIILTTTTPSESTSTHAVSQ